MRVECQNCFVDVIPMENSCCPACGVSLISQQAGLRTKITFSQGERKGSHCMRCGNPTRSTAKIFKKSRNHNYQPNPGGHDIQAHPLALLLNFVAGKYRHSVEVNIPLCERCRKEDEPEPKYIDFEKRTMTFIGHCALRDEMRTPARSSTLV